MKQLLICAALGILGIPQSTAQTGDESQLPHHSYIDDDDQRRLADLQFAVDPASGRSLRLMIGSTGPQVEPIGGFRGIQGHNRYTAEELDLVLRGKHEAKVITEDEHGEVFEGRISAGQFGTLLERRLLPNGRIDFLHHTEFLPLQIHVDAMASSNQTLQTTVVIDGQSRLTCRYRIQNGKIVDLEVQSLGHDGYIAQEAPGAKSRRLWKTVTAQAAQAPVAQADWEPRDLESRWVLMTKQLSKSPDQITKWVAWLTESKQFELLEWLALYQADAFKSHSVGQSLLEADAPQWVRVAAWHRNTSPYLGHGRQQATQMLLEASPSVVEHWLKAHQKSLDNWEPALSILHAQLEKDDIVAAESSKYLPPFDYEEIFRPLSSSSQVPVLGDRLKAEPGILYEHQVIRSISAAIISGRRSKELQQRIRTLINHPNEPVRIEALLAFSFLLPANRTDRVDDFLKIIDDENESVAVREAALLAVSYQDHPYLLLKLHGIAANPEHPTWKAAVSRLGDLGQGFTVGILQDVMKQDLTTDQVKLVGNSLGRIIVRESTTAPNYHSIARLISLVALAEAEGDAHAARIRNWVLAHCESASEKTMSKLKAKYASSIWLGAERYWQPENGQQWGDRYKTIHAEVTSSIADTKL